MIVLPSHIFIKLASDKPIKEIDTRSKINMSNLENEETIRRWANMYQLHQQNDNWWKDGALVVAGDNNLKRGVISAFHDPPYHGHPGIANTSILLSQSYWWPNMKKDIEEYVKGCAMCQANKINMALTKTSPLLQLHPHYHGPQLYKSHFVHSL